MDSFAWSWSAPAARTSFESSHYGTKNSFESSHYEAKSSSLYSDSDASYIGGTLSWLQQGMSKEPLYLPEPSVLPQTGNSFSWLQQGVTHEPLYLPEQPIINGGMKTFPWLQQGMVEEPTYLPEPSIIKGGRKRSFNEDEDDLEDIALACLDDPFDQPQPAKKRRSEEGDALFSLYHWKVSNSNSAGTFEQVNPHYYLPSYIPSIPTEEPTYIYSVSPVAMPTNIDDEPESEFPPIIPERHNTSVDLVPTINSGTISPNTSLFTQHVQNAIEGAIQSPKQLSSSFSVESLLADPFKTTQNMSLYTQHVQNEIENAIKSPKQLSSSFSVESLLADPVKKIDDTKQNDTPSIFEGLETPGHATLPITSTGGVTAGTTIETAIGPISISYSLQANHFSGSKNKSKKSSTVRPSIQCGVCSKQLENKYKLKVHMNSHTGERPYVCDICNKGFMRSHHLSAHRRLHDPLSRYPCPRCGQEFKQNKDRLVHVVSDVCVRRDQHLVQDAHGGWNCITCKKSFTNHKSAKVHATTHNRGKRRLTCPVCQADFTGKRECSLVSHCIEMHKDYLKSLGVY